MSGRAKVKIYEYNKLGKLIRIYNTIQEVFDEYYEGKKRPLFFERKSKDGRYSETPADTIISKERLGRDFIRKEMRINKSKYVVKSVLEKKQPISAYNLLGEKIATFRSILIASILTGIDIKTISYSVKRPTTSRKKHTKSVELLFKYEE